MTGRRHRRVLLKLSGEAFRGAKQEGIDVDATAELARAVTEAASQGIETAVVVGGGNFIRGAAMAGEHVSRATADYMGMLATVINALAFQDAIENLGVETRVMTALSAEEVAEPYIRRRALRHIEKGRIVILAGGTGNPYQTTDTTAALRAMEMGAEILLKATKVDGVYDKDPKTHSNAVRFEQLGYMDAINRKLRVMDATAITHCMENGIPIVVFSASPPSNIVRAARGERIGTLIGGMPDVA